LGSVAAAAIGVQFVKFVEALRPKPVVASETSRTRAEPPLGGVMLSIGRAGIVEGVE
jgi:hypothetical protein